MTQTSNNHQTHSVLKTKDGRSIAYHKTEAVGDSANLPGIVFLGGFKSDMEGSKAIYLEEWARTHGRAFLRFDYSGHGQSSEDFLDGCIGDWAADAQEAINALTDGKQILVGSSMGGWISLLFARANPEKCAALVGIAAAPDFTEDGMWDAFTDEQKTEMANTGQVALPSDYSDDPYIITQRLIEDGRNQLVLRDNLPLPFPVRLLQGTADTDVPQERALILLEHAQSPDIRLQLVKGADHRFSGERELSILGATLEELSTILR